MQPPCRRTTQEASWLRELSGHRCSGPATNRRLIKVRKVSATGGRLETPAAIISPGAWSPMLKGPDLNEGTRKGPVRGRPLFQVHRRRRKDSNLQGLSPHRVRNAEPYQLGLHLQFGAAQPSGTGRQVQAGRSLPGGNGSSLNKRHTNGRNGCTRRPDNCRQRGSGLPEKRRRGRIRSTLSGTDLCY